MSGKGYLWKGLLLALLLTVALLSGCGSGKEEMQEQKQEQDKSAAEQTESGTAGIEEVKKIEGVDGTVTCYAEIDIQDYGTITVALFGKDAPETVANFVELAESGFYDGLTFHRIMDGFMMQGGDPEGTGAGGSGKNITGEFSANGFDNKLPHIKGAVSMARAQDYNSASSQFFIVQTGYPSLDGQYAVFGYVTEGIEIVDQICADAEPVDNNGTIPSEAQPVINSIVIKEQPE